MRQIFSVARFEFLSFAKSPTFIGMTIFMVLLALIGPAIPVIVRTVGEISPERTIAVVDATNRFSADSFALYVSPRAVFFDNIEDAREAVNSGEHNYALHLNDGRYTLYVTSMGIGVVTIENQISAMYRSLYRVAEFSAAGVDAGLAAQIIAFNPETEFMILAPDGEIAEDTAYGFLETFVYFIAMVMVLYMGLLIGGQYLLTTVIREKSTKTMELLVTSCKPGYMLNGKVFGVGAAILSQIILVVGAALLSMVVSGSLFIEDVLEDAGMDFLSSVELQPDMLAYMVIFFLLGFVMYSYIYAALASTVSRMEDANSIAILPTMLIVAAFFISYFGAMNNPASGLVNITSQIPLFAPFVMFMRISLGLAATWEIIMSILGQIAMILLLSYLGSKIYRMGTLMYGNKPKLKDFISALRSAR
ncbi:MAG: ABC transporter permease [Defluviitaleaceae bacterium]|nr:ABC transporter permease [Defluviitaleaceae bacterium]